MTQAGARKTKGRKAKATVSASGGDAADVSTAVSDRDPQARMRAMQARIASLEQQLAAANERIRHLETTREQVRHRIDWVIDSLNEMLSR